MRRFLSLVCILTFAAASAAIAQQGSGDEGAFAVTGMGGAGGMFTPTVSPDDPNLMFLSCDMSGAYRSADAGAHWRLIHYKYLSGSLRARPAFAGKAIYWAGNNDGLRVSRDKGLTWQPVAKEPWPWKGEIRHIAAVDAEPVVLAVGTD